MLSRAAVPKQAIITQLAGVPTPDLASFARQLRDLPHGAHVPLQYYVFGERHRRKTAIMHIDRNWWGFPSLDVPSASIKDLFRVFMEE